MIEKRLKAIVRELKLNLREEKILETKLVEKTIKDGVVYEIMDLYLKDIHYYFDHGIRLFMLSDKDDECVEIFHHHAKSRDFVLHQHKIKSERNIKSKKCIDIVINDEISLLRISKNIINNAYKEVDFTV